MACRMVDCLTGWLAETNAFELQSKTWPTETMGLQISQHAQTLRCQRLRVLNYTQQLGKSQIEASHGVPQREKERECVQVREMKQGSFLGSRRQVTKQQID